MHKKKSGIIVSVFLCIAVYALPASAQKDSLLTLTDVLNIVRSYHPVALQANLKTDGAIADRQVARGAFDPIAFVDNEQKTFSGTNYYYYTQGGLQIPTWYGIDVNAGFENNGGQRLQNDITVGKSSYVGVSVPLLKNLVLDKRRAALQQAAIIINQTEAERRNIYNDLLYQASAAYWEWVRAYVVYINTSRVVAVSQRRVQIVRQSYLGGDRAAIDTIEALTQLQSFLFQQNDAQLTFQNAGLDLSVYLWQANLAPYNLPSNVLPDTLWQATNIPSYPIPQLDQLLTSLRLAHPKLQTLQLKQEVLEIDRRLKAQNLLPSLKVKYNFLRKGYEPWKGIGQNFMENNFKYGFGFSVPLFLRQARGEVTLANIKLRNNSLEQLQTGLEMENKVKSYFNQLVALRQQVSIFEQALNNYNLLLRAEEVKFSIGESSLFLLNSRENKVLETLQKLIELKTKFFKTQVALQWAAGILQ